MRYAAAWAAVLRLPLVLSFAWLICASPPALAAQHTAWRATPPNAPSPSDMKRFTGTYELDPGTVLTVTQQDGALFVRLTGRAALRLAPKGPTTFTADAVGAELDFTLPDLGPATSVTLHQRGQVIAMARIGEAQARLIESATAIRMSRDTPAPGSREALAHVVDGIIAGTPDYTTMTPKMADVTRAQLVTLHGVVGALGLVQSITFVRVGGRGQDIYLLQQKQGATTWQIALAGGKIAGLWVSPAP